MWWQKITITKRGTILERHTKIIIVIVIIIDENVIRSEYDTGTTHSDTYKVLLYWCAKWSVWICHNAFTTFSIVYISAYRFFRTYYFHRWIHVYLICAHFFICWIKIRFHSFYWSRRKWNVLRKYFFRTLNFVKYIVSWISKNEEEFLA